LPRPRARRFHPRRAFAIGIALNVAIVVVEATYGFLANSMALIADAGHNLSDVLGLVVAWAGAVMAGARRRRASPTGSRRRRSSPR
jgi:cobalt-zinc-cadmium efflux system protein